jgi:hypothetical protein
MDWRRNVEIRFDPRQLWKRSALEYFPRHHVIITGGIRIKDGLLAVKSIT